MTFGLDEAAWKIWLAYRKDRKKPLPLASYELCRKRMAALGPQQMEAVEHSIANGYTGLFAPKSAKKVVQQMTNDQKKFEALKLKAEQLGFRQPLPEEDLIGYKTLLERYESNAWLRSKTEARV